jgi:hypothetical protein
MIVPVFLISAVLSTAAAGQESMITLSNHHVRLEVRHSGGTWQETYAAWTAGVWRTLLASGHPRRQEPSLMLDGRSWEPGFSQAVHHTLPNGDQSVLFTIEKSGTRLTKRVTLHGEDDYFRVEVTCSIAEPTGVSHILSTYAFVPDGAAEAHRCFPDFVFTPQLRPEEGDVIGDHTFRSPALILQRKTLFAALVPDITAIDVRDRQIQSAADVRVDSGSVPMVSYGLLPWVKRAHVYYSHADSMAVQLRDTTVRFGYFLFLRADAPEQCGYRRVVRFLWEEFGRKSLTSAPSPQQEPFSSYINKAWYRYLPQVALDTVYNGVPVTLLRQARLAWSNKLHSAADNDTWFNVWFNALRTAYGMALWGTASRDQRLTGQAERVLNLALAAPNPGGVAPTIFYLDSVGGHWVADHAWGGIRNGEYYAMFHNAWTGYWLLQWSDLVPARRTEILTYTRRFADFLCARQAPGGVIPSWYHPQSLEPAPEFRDENAETAGAALFLAELAHRTNDPRYRDAAVKALDYILHDIVPGHKWFDFETFFSCSRKPLGFFDEFTHQHPQNTLSMHQAAEACLVLEDLTGKRMYRDRGEEILDYLCLYQQVWSPQWLSCPLLGGFGVQNTDGEWSDSRQAYFAVTLMRYYQRTGRREYCERAVAALRAQFSLFESPDSPRTAENYAHGAADKLAGVTGLHWGTGSAVVSIHLLAPQFGDAYVNLRGEWGIGIDGCTVENTTLDGSTVQVRIRDDVHAPRAIRIVCDEPLRPAYRLVVNGRDQGVRPAEVLREGTMVNIP